jgi:hypothetical protein
MSQTSMGVPKDKSISVSVRQYEDHWDAVSNHGLKLCAP